MHERLKQLVLDALRVPSEPHPPAGDARSLRVFRAAPNYWRYRLALWGLRQLGALVGLALGFFFAAEMLSRTGVPLVSRLVWGLEALAWLGFVAQIPVSLFVLRLDYELRWYLVTDRSLRIREGVLTVREQTLTFANVQQVGIRQGPLQRLLGIADVHVRTAGGGSGGAQGEEGGFTRSLHEGFFRGVADAAVVRDAIRERVRLHRDAGLGDPDDARLPLPSGDGVGGADEATALPAAQALLDEVRALRRALAPEAA